ncbi:MAG: 2Fe-2S iron-sulfur cluster-binding protein [Gammaproteobacteria bacterium]
MSDYAITLEASGETFTCRDGQNVLAAMERLGRRGIPVGCRGGGCGVCKVQVLGQAGYRTLKMSRAQVSVAEEAQGICLACKLIPESDLLLRPLGVLQSRLAGLSPGRPR